MNKQDKQEGKGRPISDEEIVKANTTEGVEMNRLPDGSVEGKIKMSMSLKDMVFFYLSLWRGSKELPEEKRTSIAETLSYLKEYLVSLDFEPKNKTITYKAKTTADKDVMNKHLQEDYIQGAIGIIFPKEAERKKKNGRIKMGDHAIGNLLKRPNISYQPTLWDTILPAEKERIEEKVKPHLEMINRKGEGIQLSPGELKLLFALQGLLYEKSQTNKPKELDYYKGNQEGLPVTFKTKEGGEVTLIAPGLSFTLYELTKAYGGGDEVGGGENVKIVAKLLSGLAYNPEKWALIRYTRKEKLAQGRIREYFIERYSPLVTMAEAGYKVYLEGRQIDEKREILAYLNPVFVDQIATKYVEFPEDIIKRMIEGYGSENPSAITIKLITNLSRAYSNRKRLKKDEAGNYIYEEGLVRTSTGNPGLFWVIAESYMRENRKTLIKKYFDKSLETAKKVGILVSYKERNNQIGDAIGVFTLPAKWE